MHSRLPILQDCRRIWRVACLFAYLTAAFSLPALGRPHPSPSPSPTSTPSPSATPAQPADASPSPSATPALPDPVASVNGDPIHPQDLIRVSTSVLAANGRNMSELTDADRGKAYRTVLDDIITDRLVAKASANEPVSEVDVEKRLTTLRNQFGANFDAEIKKSGQTVDQIRHNIRTQIAQQEWVEQQIAPEIKVTPEEVEKYYKESPPNRFDAPEMIRASHILVAVRRDAPPEDALSAENKINDLAARIRKGESFEALAKQYSDDPSAKQTSGDLDYFSRERIMPEFADAAFKLKVGEVSAPVRTQFGYHLIKVTDRKPAHIATLDEARDQIASFLGEQKRSTAILALVQRLKDAAQIQIFLH